MVEFAEALERAVIKQVKITFMWSDMINDRSCCDPTFLLAHAARWVLKELDLTDPSPGLGAIQRAIRLSAHNYGARNYVCHND